MKTMTAMPAAPAANRLDGVRIAITHDKEQVRDQDELFRALGAEVFFYPCIEIAPYEHTGCLLYTSPSPRD